MNNIIMKSVKKKFIAAIFSSSLLLTGCTVFTIWFYLTNLDRLDIFLDTTSIGSTLIVIFFFIILATLTFSMLFFISSFMLMFTYNIIKNNFKESVGAAHRIGAICFINSLSICTITITGISLHYFKELNGLCITASSLFLMITISFVTTYFKITKNKDFLFNDVSLLSGKLKTIWVTFKLSLQFTIPGTIQLIPLLFFITQINFSNESNMAIQTTALVFLSIIFIITGILPGSIYINEQEKGFSLKNITIPLVSPLLLIIVVSAIFRPIPNMIANMAMNLSGINDWRIHQYYIETSSHSPSTFNGTLWNTRYYQDIPNRFFITGVNIFSLGNTKLICPLTIRDAVKQSLKDNPLESEEREERMNNLRNTAMKCISFSKDDIHTWDSPITTPIYYEKVKLAPENPGGTILRMLK